MSNPNSSQRIVSDDISYSDISFNDPSADLCSSRITSTPFSDDVSSDDSVDSHAYSAPLSDQQIPTDPLTVRTHHSNSWDELSPKTLIWPWFLGIFIILAAVILVVSVTLRFIHVEHHKLATPTRTITSLLLPTGQTSYLSGSLRDNLSMRQRNSLSPMTPLPSPSLVTTTIETTTVETTTVTIQTPAEPPKPLPITYSITGIKAPFDQITITYIDAEGQRQVQRNAYIPWKLTLTLPSASDVGSVEATSLLRLSKLNCTIVSSDGTLLSSNDNDAPQVSC